VVVRVLGLRPTSTRDDAGGERHASFQVQGAGAGRTNNMKAAAEAEAEAAEAAEAAESMQQRKRTDALEKLAQA
jgi:hypothetical protein